MGLQYLERLKWPRPFSAGFCKGERVMATTNTNPFFNFLHTDPPVVVGRDHLISDILQGITLPQPLSWQITSLRTMGASALLRYLSHPEGAITRSPHREFLPAIRNSVEEVIFLYFDFMSAFVGESLAQWLCQQISQDSRIKDEFDKTDSGAPAAARLHTLFAELGRKKRRAVLVFDHFDRVLKKLEKGEAERLRPLVGLAAFVISTELPLVTINPESAASLFAGQLQPVRLEPLTRTAGRALLEQAAAGHALNLKPYFDLADQAGTHPYYLLTAAAELYTLQQRQGQGEAGGGGGLSAETLAETLAWRLESRFDGEFTRFWNHLNDNERRVMTLVVQKTDPATLQPAERRARSSLEEKGLLIRADGERFLPFSELWGRFVRRQSDLPDQQEAAGLTQSLTPREQALFDFLRHNPDRLLSYDEILKAVWESDDTPEARHSLRQFVARLRVILPDGKITTNRGRGYTWHP
jgi:hypothetical protein